MMVLLLGGRVELRGSLGGRRRRYGCCGEGRSCSYLSGFLVVCTIHSASGTTLTIERQSFAAEAQVKFQVQPTGVVWWAEWHCDSQVCLLVLPFPLPVPLRQHSVLIQSSTTVAV